jgi:hypothetical protein
MTIELLNTMERYLDSLTTDMENLIDALTSEREARRAAERKAGTS